MDIEQFTSELKRRGVVRAAGWYAIVSWVLMLVVSMTVPILLGPSTILRPLYALALIGLPIWCGGAWLLGAGRPAPEPERARLGGSGVALLAAVSVLIVASAALILRGPAHRPAEARSIAVLPFESLSDDPADAYFAEGVHGDIISQLARVAELKVISRSSVMPYRATTRNLRDVAAELGVATVLEGSVRRSAGRVRITAQLIDAASDSNLWAESYDRELTDVFAIQSEVASAIAHALQATLSDTERARLDRPLTRYPEAYDLYLRGREYHTRAGRTEQDWKSALELYAQAVTIDPDFARAHADAAQLHVHMYWYGRDRTPLRLQWAKEAAERALRADPDLPQAHLALGYYRYQGLRDYPGALAEFETARRMAPGDAEIVAAIGYVERRLGRWDDTLAHIDQAIALDPRNTLLPLERATTLHNLRRYDEADRAYERALTLGPDNMVALAARGRLHLNSDGDDLVLAAEVATAPAAARLDPDFRWATFELCLRRSDAACASGVLDDGPDGALELQDLLIPRRFLEGHALRLRGDLAGSRAAFQDAQRELAEVTRTTPDDARAWIVLAMTEAVLGRHDPARDAAQRAVELVPLERDALVHPRYQLLRASVLTQVGDRAEAVAILEQLLAIPSEVSVKALAHDPQWAALRKEPRFLALIGEAPGRG